MCSQCRGSSAGGACDGPDDDAVSALLLLLVVHSGITRHRFRARRHVDFKESWCLPCVCVLQFTNTGICSVFKLLLRPSRLDAVTKNIAFYDILALCTVPQPQTGKAKKKTPKNKLFPIV